MWCVWMNYNDCPWLQGLYTPLPEYRDQVKRGAKPWPLWTRKQDAFGAVVDAFNGVRLISVQKVTVRIASKGAGVPA